MSQPPLHINTPVIFSQYLANKYGKSVYFKLEALQPSASFKLRGIGKLCQHYASLGVKQFVASSGGNSGISVAYAGMKLNIPTIVFIPSTSHQLYIDEIKSYGAEVIVAGDVWDDAHLAALKCSDENNAAYIPPFDDPIIWDGHSTIIQEVAELGIRPDVIIAAVGGGGLACGLVEGMKKQAWDDIPLLAVETTGADSFAASIKAKKLVSLDKITSRATSLGAKRVAPHLIKLSEERIICPVTVSDADAEFGARAFAKDMRLLVELSAGSSLSVPYSNHPAIKDYDSILVVVCGGVNTDFFKL
jgi:L-serine/L-threonine ammonia-lyase